LRRADVADTVAPAGVDMPSADLRRLGWADASVVSSK